MFPVQYFQKKNSIALIFLKVFIQYIRLKINTALYFIIY